MLSCTEIRFVISCFVVVAAILRNLESKSGFLLRNSIKLTYSKLGGKRSFDMFYKSDC